MTTAYSLPENTDFYQRYATLAPVLSKLGIFAQIINALCEFGIIHALLSGHIAHFFGAFAAVFAFIGAVFGVFILEMGQRTFLPYSARAVLFRRFSGLDLAMSIAVFACSLALFSTSLYLSFKGSRDLVEQMAPPPALLNENEADTTERQTKAGAQSAWKADSIEISVRYARLIETANRATTAQIATHQREINSLQIKERKTGQRYSNLTNIQQDKIMALRAGLAQKTAQLEQDGATEKKEAKSRRTAIEGKAESARAAVTTTNIETKEAASAKTAGYGAGLGWFTVIFHFLLLFSIVLQEVHRKGSGIELRAMPNQYHFSESIFAKFLGMVSDKWNYHARAWIDRLSNKTPAPERPKTPHPLFDAPVLTMRRAAPTDLTESAQAATNGNGNHRISTQNFSTSERTNINIPYRENAVRYNWKAPLSEPIVPSVNNATVTTDHFNKECAHCGMPFYAKVAWQKYCREQCKLDAHEAKHGARFEPSKARYKKAGLRS